MRPRHDNDPTTPTPRTPRTRRERRKIERRAKLLIPLTSAVVLLWGFNVAFLLVQIINNPAVGSGLTVLAGGLGAASAAAQQLAASKPMNFARINWRPWALLGAHATAVPAALLATLPPLAALLGA